MHGRWPTSGGRFPAKIDARVGFGDRDGAGGRRDRADAHRTVGSTHRRRRRHRR